MCFGYNLPMRSADLTKDQRNELVAWVEGGFREYADLCGKESEELAALFKDSSPKTGTVVTRTTAKHSSMPYQGNIHRDIRTQIESYAKEFGRVLRDEGVVSDPNDPLDLVQLRSDLHGLMKSRCPAIALLELMLACTSDFGVTIPDLLLRAWDLDGYLDGISGGPRYFKIPSRPRRFKNDVPLSIQFMLEAKPYHASINGVSQDARVAFHLAYLYTFLKRFKYGLETLTCLLRAMQCVRRRVPTVADYLKTTGRAKHTLGAHQRRVFRFFEAYPAIENVMKEDVRKYLSGAADGRRNRKTLLGKYCVSRKEFAKKALDALKLMITREQKKAGSKIVGQSKEAPSGSDMDARPVELPLS